jgi:2-keto-4-pentenoate hydratase/2-oxohepta-3-ene-1,7-dioic acid hydratase in catechol pathway
VLVSTDELSDRHAIPIVCAINGEVRQDGNTSDLIFDVPTLVSYLSSITTLVTGDIIFTGTPRVSGRRRADSSPTVTSSPPRSRASAP